MFAALALAAAVTVTVPPIVVHTGRLVDGNDKAIAGPQTLTFSLFVASVKPQTPDTPVWSETYKTLLDASGVYSVQLGGATDDAGESGKKPFDATTWTSGPLFLEIAVNGEALSPRLLVGSAPWALAAGDALAFGGQAPAYYATAANDAAKLPLAGGALTGALTGTAATFTGAVAAQSFAGAHTGDGSGLVNVTGTDATKLPLAGGALTGALSGTAATFTGAVAAQSFAGAHTGDGSGLVNVTGTDATKLALAGGTLTGALSGAAATFSGAVTAQSFSGNGAGLTNVTGTDATKLPLAGGVLTGALNGTAATFSGRAQAATLGVTGAATLGSLSVTGVASLASLGVGTASPQFPIHAVGNDYNIMSETTSTTAAARVAARGPGAQDMIELDATPGLALIQSGKSTVSPLAVAASNWSVDKSGNLAASGDVTSYGQSTSIVINMRAIVTKSAANLVCPSGTAIYTPRSYLGKTGNQICAADSRGRTTCTGVKFIYVTEANVSAGYAPSDGSCGAAVGAPWPWGYDYGAPDTLDSEWGHGNTYAVCCN